MNSGLVAQRISKKITHGIGLYCGESFPFYYVTEHPKSGGSWLAKMVSDYLQLPFPQFAKLPLAFSCVILNHWQYHPKLRRVIYLYRDGRDVMVSYYFHHLHMSRHADNPVPNRITKTYEKLFGKHFDPNDIERHLPRFIEHEFAHPGRGTSVNWRDHVDGWFQSAGDGVTFVSYEELLLDCHAALKRVIESCSNSTVDPWRLDTTIEKMSMKRQTGRDPGDSQVSVHSRKGIAGDWKNYFSRDAAKIFNDLAGDTLVRLGYESDTNWVNRHFAPTPSVSPN